MTTTRRDFLRSAAAVTLGFHGLQSFVRGLGGTVRAATVGGVGYGPLIADPERIFDLPAGFSYRVISRIGERMDDGLIVPGDPDGMAAFSGPDGKIILIRNHELEPKERAEKSPFGPKNELMDRIPTDLIYDLGRARKPCIGGTTTLLYDPTSRRVERQFLSLAGTENNCAGGPTPWNSWISCEESTSKIGEDYQRDHGWAFEVPATLDGHPVAPEPIKPMGRFRREAVAVDPRSSAVYQTEDVEDGLIYRFLPDKPGELLAGGRTQALMLRDRPGCDTRNWLGTSGQPLFPPLPVGQRWHVKWLDLDQIDSPDDDLRLRGFAAGAARFARGEGMWYGRDSVYFACTNGGRNQMGQIWRYHPSPFEGTPRETEAPGMLELFIEPNNQGVIENADNLTVSPWGDLVVCEDGSGEQFLIGVTPQGQCYRLGRNAKSESELAGCVFSPDGKTLFLNLQADGLTLAITGPWRGASDVG
ncbi:MAG: DUF839 domain-containing protein [Phycisphaerales bacterium]|nr:DUF839 domain-containing protein [Phycisphaerales bacterium]